MPFWEFEDRQADDNRLSGRFRTRATSRAFRFMARSALQQRGIDPDTIPSLASEAGYQMPRLTRGEFRGAIPSLDTDAAVGRVDRQLERANQLTLKELSARAQSVGASLPQYVALTPEQRGEAATRFGARATRELADLHEEFVGQGHTPQGASTLVRGTLRYQHVLRELLAESERQFGKAPPEDTPAYDMLQDRAMRQVEEEMGGELEGAERELEGSGGWFGKVLGTAAYPFTEAAKGIQAAARPLPDLPEEYRPMLYGPFYEPPGREPSTIARLGAAYQRYVNPWQAWYVQQVQQGMVGLQSGETERQQRILSRPDVNPWEAVTGDSEQIARAQEVLDELGPMRLPVEVIYDPLNLVPIVGFTKAKHFYGAAKIPLMGSKSTAQRIIAGSPRLRATLKALRLDGAISLPEFQPVMGLGDEPLKVRNGLLHSARAADDEIAEITARRLDVIGEGFEPPRPPPPVEAVPGLMPDGVPPSMNLWRKLEEGLFLSDNAGDLLRGTADLIADIPVVRNILRVTAGPAAIARTFPIIRAGVVYRRLQGIMNSELTVRVAELKTGYDNLFQEVATGEVVLGGKQVAFGDFATDVLKGGRKYASTFEQRRWVAQSKKLIDDVAAQYEAVTGDKIKLLGDDYWPRFRLDERGRVFIKGRIGAKQSPVKTRVIEEQQDAIARGMAYASPLETVRLYGQALQKMTRDELLLQVVVQDKLSRTVGKGLSAAIRSLRAKVKTWKKTKPDEVAEIAKMERQLDKLVGIRARAGTAAMGPPPEVSGFTLGPAFSKHFFERETLPKIMEIVGPGLIGKPGALLRGATYVAAVPRFLVTGALDVGHFFLQGLTLLATNPDDWARAVGHSIVSLVSPEHFNRLMATHPAFKRAARYGTDLMGTEWTEVTRRSGWLTKRVPGAKAIGTVAGAFPRSFETFIATGKALNFDSLAELAIKGGLPEEELYRIGGYVNTKLGTTNLLGLGLSSTQRQVEAAFLLYSPRYTRSILGMMGWTLGKGIPARDAQRALATMLFGGATSFYGFARAAGLSHEETLDRLNPASGGKFMSIPIGGNEYGVGSAYRAFIGFLGSLCREDSWDFDSWDEAAWDNPMVRYLRARTSPTTGTLVDFIDGEDFIGKLVSLEDFTDDPMRLLDYSARRFLPLNVEATIEARGPILGRIAAGLTETIGGRAFPRSAYALFTEAREAEFQQKKALGEQPYAQYATYEELKENDSPAAETIDAAPSVQEAVERMERERRWKTETEEQRAFKSIEQTREEQQKEQLADDKLLTTGKMDVDTWQGSLRRRSTEYFARRDQIVEDYNLQFEGEPPPESVNAAIEDYFSVNVEDYVDPFTSGVAWNEFFDARDEVLSGLSPQDRKRVMDYVRQYATPAVLAFKNAQDELRPYWDIEVQAWDRLRERRPEVFGSYASIDDYKAAKLREMAGMGVPSDQRHGEVSRLYTVRAFESLVGELRFRYRLQNPEIDALLAKWYGNRPAREQVRAGRPSTTQGRFARRRGR